MLDTLAQNQYSKLANSQKMQPMSKRKLTEQLLNLEHPIFQKISRGLLHNNFLTCMEITVIQTRCMIYHIYKL